ncbi:MAG: hypothetical protein J6S85_00910 [Methanobrevibacter sp.]|nr:hypothetical protein [Methanobrevibacter sp.]MBO7712092.1 hypothetical protein [Methanobrevibacter sp.]
MAVTLFHKVINNNHIKIINNSPKETKTQKRAIKVSNNIKTTRHTITENRTSD